jgi:hypothetical protein
MTLAAMLDFKSAPKTQSGRGPSSEHFWQVWLISVLQFQRRRFKCEKLIAALIQVKMSSNLTFLLDISMKPIMHILIKKKITLLKSRNSKFLSIMTEFQK